MQAGGLPCWPINANLHHVLAATESTGQMSDAPVHVKRHALGLPYDHQAPDVHCGSLNIALRRPVNKGETAAQTLHINHQ